MNSFSGAVTSNKASYLEYKELRMVMMIIEVNNLNKILVLAAINVAIPSFVRMPTMESPKKPNQ